MPAQGTDLFGGEYLPRRCRKVKSFVSKGVCCGRSQRRRCRSRSDHPLQRRIEFTAAGLCEAHVDDIRVIAKSVATAAGLPDSDVDDLAQHGFVVAMKAAARFLGEGYSGPTFWWYALGGVRMEITDFASTRHGEVSRRHSRAARGEGKPISHVGLDCVSDVGAEDLSEAAAEERESEEREAAVRRLESLCDQVGIDDEVLRLVLRDELIDGLSESEIAERRGVTAGWVRSNSARAVKLIRDCCSE